MKNQQIQKKLNQIKQVYNSIAGEFSQTRKYGWSEFNDFLSYIKPGEYIADIGCGNGRLADLFPINKYKYIGIDNAENFIKIAEDRNKDHKFLLGDILNIPLNDCTIDHVFCIAAFHHLPDEFTRKKGADELFRILKEGGTLFLMVWNLLDQKKYKEYEKEAGEFYIPWGDKKILRYYYAFKLEELESLLIKSGFKILKKEKDKNLVLICKK